jgi:lipoprotein-releasing system ATP-binding protein
MIYMRGVQRGFVMADGRFVEILRGIDLTVARGDSLAIMGPSGSGKSSLLNILGALDRPDAGEVRIDGASLGGLDERARTALRRRVVGHVFQLHYLLPQLTAMENALVPAWADGSGTAGLADAERLLRRVGLGERMHQRPGQLSGGERQRVALVRALVMHPGLLLADEPTGALDPAAAASLTDLLVELNREEGVTLVVATHSIGLAARMRTRMELRAGRLVVP